MFQNKLSRIESEVNISASIVQQLASQVEQAKLQVNKDTPVFTTIQPVTIPFERSAPKRSLIVIVFGFLGLVFLWLCSCKRACDGNYQIHKIIISKRVYLTYNLILL